jgi:hypothetical protein
LPADGPEICPTRSRLPRRVQWCADPADAEQAGSLRGFCPATPTDEVRRTALQRLIADVHRFEQQLAAASKQIERVLD